MMARNPGSQNGRASDEFSHTLSPDYPQVTCSSVVCETKAVSLGMALSTINASISRAPS